VCRAGGSAVRFARALGVVMAIGMIAGPILAANTPHRGDCRKMTRQIARYERDAKWADQRGNEMWEDASKDRAKQLTSRRDGMCPQYKKPNPLAAAAAKAADMIAAAAKAAAPYFIPGPY
jgi:hypothetical protein